MITIETTYADRKGFRAAVIAGENEFSRNMVQLKNLSAKTAQDHPLEGLVAAVRQLLKGSS